MKNKTPITILMADDDADDRNMAAEALADSRLVNDFHTVGDAAELMEYLDRRGKYADPVNLGHRG